MLAFKLTRFTEEAGEGEGGEGGGGEEQEEEALTVDLLMWWHTVRDRTNLPT